MSLGKINRILIRIKNRLKYLITRDLFYWEGESCKRCGRTQRTSWSVSDNLWYKVHGGEYGNVKCLDCFLEIASRSGVKIKKSDIEFHGFIS